MRGNVLLDKMELVCPAYIESADCIPISRKKNKSRISVRLAAAAACITIAIYAGIKLLPRKPDLPILTVTEAVDGMGFEGYYLYDISELVNENPWSEDMRLTKLPVYQNALTYDEYQIASGADFDKMREFLLDVAGRLGLDTSVLTVTDDAPSEEKKQKSIERFRKRGAAIPDGYFNPTKLIIETDDLRIEVDQTMAATVRFKTALPIPEEYNILSHASYDDMKSVAEFLKHTHKDLIGIDDPQVNICGGSYSTDGEQRYSIDFFDMSGKSTEQILHYNLNRVTFGFNDDGELYIVRIFSPDLSQKVGDYPIINTKQATELLAAGNYITTVQYEMPGTEYIGKVELIYRDVNREEYYMPYYRFYVELPEQEGEGGLKTYGAYYVPAIESAYISNMPVWDGGFN